MKHVILAAVATAALLLPLSSLAATTPSASSLAHQTCSQLKQADGATQFAATYGTNATKSNAFGRCVSLEVPAAKATIANASKTCSARQAADPAGFLTTYGTNGKGGKAGNEKNAMGKCVSSTVRASQVKQAHAISTAAASCKAARKADAAAFVAKYGGKSSNAYGKCVAALSRTK